MRGLKEDVSLKEFSNYRIGGPARFFFDAEGEDGVRFAVLEAQKRGLDLFVLGGGTNLLISDDGFSGLVLKPNLNFLEAEGEHIKAGAGVLMNDLLDFAARHGLSGLEWAGGLPGTLGGAIRGNAGAFKGETKDLTVSVQSFDVATGEVINRANKDCRFGYRTSIFKERGGQEIILSAVLKLKNGDQKKIAQAIQEKVDYRLRRHPMEYPNIGSIFKNVPLAQIDADAAQTYAEKGLRGSVFSLRGSAVPVKIDPFPVIPTAFLISEAGLKGVSFGGAMISPKHPNFIVNVLNAAAPDIKNLIELVKMEVHKKFGIKLEEEIQLL